MATTDPTRSSSFPTPARRWAASRARCHGVSATELGATAVKAAVERAGLKGEDVDKVFMGNVLPAGLGQAPARQAALGAGLSALGRSGDHQQGLRIGHAGDDFRPRHAQQRLGRRDRRRRHGEHVERAISVEEIPLGRAHRPRHGLRPYDARRARGRLRAGPRDGHLRRGSRAGISVHPRGHGRLRDREPAPRQRRDHESAGSRRKSSA